MKTAEIKARLEANITTEAQARAFVDAIGANPIRIGWHPRMDLTIFSVAEEVSKQCWSMDRVDEALAKVVTDATPADPGLARRVEQLALWWPKDRPMPAAFILAGIVGGTAEQVEALLAADAQESA